MGTKISYKGNQVGSGNSSGAETIVDKTSLPSSGIENVIYRVTDSVSGETSYHAGNETEAETEQLAKYSDIQIIQAETIPSAGASHVGKIYQYIGATNLSYTNGYFYKCVSDGESTPSYSWEEVQVQKIDDITPHWTGTQAEYAIAASGIEDGTIVNITDDYQEGVEVVDVVEEDNEGVPTSAAVYEALLDIEHIYPNDWVSCTITNLRTDLVNTTYLTANYSPSRRKVSFGGELRLTGSFMGNMGTNVFKVECSSFPNESRSDVGAYYIELFPDDVNFCTRWSYSKSGGLYYSLNFSKGFTGTSNSMYLGNIILN